MDRFREEVLFELGLEAQKGIKRQKEGKEHSKQSKWNLIKPTHPGNSPKGTWKVSSYGKRKPTES